MVDGSDIMAVERRVKKLKHNRNKFVELYNAAAECDCMGGQCDDQHCPMAMYRTYEDFSCSFNIIKNIVDEIIPKIDTDIRIAELALGIEPDKPCITITIDGRTYEIIEMKDVTKSEGDNEN